MQITRAKATALLNKGEMTLYNESRHNPIRGFTAAQLETRIKRARAARDRSRDLAKRQKLSSRASTGSKRGTSGSANQRSLDKAAILADILDRFEARLKEVKQAGREEARATAKKTSARKTAGSKKSARRSERREGRQAARQASKATPVAKKAVKKAAKKAAKNAAKKAAKKAAQKAVKKAASNTPRKSAAKKVTPRQALRSTRKLLEAKQEAARQPKPWEAPVAHGSQVGSDGFQSTEAARRAEELQAAESRMPAIHGSAGTRGRINQGKRDSKGGH
ncbi:hypothetical protein BGP89_13120 [Luteimonas sp. JM171]|uniref:hypothetical protein n=1 Tax=Luteimonas sp. JM171 TaxID=1896164 RepID=UPI0008574E48|nr:hypothetical protein [Luteimonas sp. JM171]AOH37172.1 hypothetical protein BGP89_13120 [Luteimonas sp. JM171]